MSTVTNVEHQSIGVATRAAARLSKLVEVALDDIGLSLPQYRMMVLLADDSSVATALAQRLTVSRPSITALADGLVQRGFVERVPDAADRRRVTHSLTAAGRAALSRGDESIQSRLQTTVSHLPARKQRAAMEGLALWLEALDLAREVREEGKENEAASQSVTAGR